ncbi:MAG: hypothetical protein IJS17_07195 [Clostridia bacterium]|nr:hypothetical protein [Clostridia bacterium]
MKKHSFRIISVIMTLAIAVCCVVIPANAASSSKGNYTLTVLGDSVAVGTFVENRYRYGDVIKDMLTEDGYDVTYKNYALPKYGSRSIYYDFSEETFSLDNNLFVAFLEAPDYREGITYDEYINQLKNSDAVLVNVGENDILAKFYAMRGYNNYYRFYFGDRNNAIFEQDIRDGKVDWIYTWNSKKAKEFEDRFEDSYEYYMEENIKALKALNPTGQIIINNVFNPYRYLVDRLHTYENNVETLKNQLLDLANPLTVLQLGKKLAAIKESVEAVKTSGKTAFTSFFGTTLDKCGGLDISSLRTTQKILYKIQYVRMESCAVNMFRIAGEVVERLCEKYGCTMADIEGTDVCYHMTGDMSHPSIEGHKIIADVIYDLMEK